MNEITRIHIAKTAYDIEIAAKKQLEKYIKSLETYTQDADVLVDIEIRITELLAERGVAAGGVISSDDVSAVRKQLGEPYEFADGEGDIAVGPDEEVTSRRLYRSTDDAVLGGVLSGVAAYYNVNPLWTRLVFILILIISFGSGALAYILFWILIPPARTATQKLALAGRDVTLESIKELNIDEVKARPNRLAPVLQQVFSIVLGGISALSGLVTLAGVIWLVIGVATFNTEFLNLTNGFVGLGEGYNWLALLLFWVVIAGLALLTALFGLIAYAFFAKKLTKSMVITGVVIIILGIASVATVVGVSATQSLRVANESRSLVRDTKVTLPKEFASVRSLTFSVTNKESNTMHENMFSQYAQIRYVVDNGPARYELSALPSTNTVITTDGANATVELEIPNSFRNSFVQPVLTIYGPALESISSTNKSDSVGIEYASASQDALTITSIKSVNIQTTGSFSAVTVNGSGSVDLGSSAVQVLKVNAKDGLSMVAGTVRELTVSQPDVCPSGTYQDNTVVKIVGITSKQMNYNGVVLPAETHRTSCAAVIVEPETIDRY
ncbi:MAG: PspC domain-containing protein [Candidatus Saccharimonadaceae bacterium]